MSRLPLLGLALWAGCSTSEPVQVHRSSSPPDRSLRAGWCEASALLAPAGGHSWLVGDNERSRALLGAGSQFSRLVADRPLAYRQDDGSTWWMDDVEALARGEAGALVLSSHGRRSLEEREGRRSCPRESERMRVARVQREGSGLWVRASWSMEPASWLERVATVPACVEGLVDPGVRGARELCTEIVAAEQAAERGESEGCESSFELEAAVQLPTAEGEQLWVGLRAPVGERGAPLLRIHPPESAEAGLRVAAVRWVDLEGGGMRGLSREGDRLLGIAGPAPDAGEGAPFRLFSLPVDALNQGESLQPRWLGALPDSAEGLAAVGPWLWVVTDGAEGDRGSCKEPATSHRLPLPPRAGSP